MSQKRENGEGKKLPYYLERKLDRLGLKLKRKPSTSESSKDKKDEVKLLSGNEEITRILPSLLNSYRSDVSGRYLLNHSAFKYLTNLFEHQEEKLNYLKYEAVVEHLNSVMADKLAREGRKKNSKSPLRRK